MLKRCREGDREAFGELFRRHHDAALKVAAATSRSIDPEDAVAEAVTRIWAALQDGRGPEEAFGPYLRATVRNVAITTATRSREDAADDDRLDLALRHRAGADELDFTEVMAERALVAAAFNSLPERWQWILWQVDVEGRQAADVAQDLRLSANSTAALTKRARDGLTRAWLQQHVDASASTPECEWVLDHAGGFARRSLSASHRARVDAHLQECASCERATRRVAYLAGWLRVAVVAVGGSAVGVAGWSGRIPPRAEAATARPSRPGTLRRLVRTGHAHPGLVAGVAAAAAVSAVALGAAQSDAQNRSSAVAAIGASEPKASAASAGRPDPNGSLTAAATPLPQSSSTQGRVAEPVQPSPSPEPTRAKTTPSASASPTPSAVVTVTPGPIMVTPGLPLLTPSLGGTATGIPIPTRPVRSAQLGHTGA